MNTLGKKTEHLENCVVHRQEVIMQSTLRVSTDCLIGTKSKEDCDLPDVDLLNTHETGKYDVQNWFWDNCTNDKLDTVEELLEHLEDKFD